MFYDFMVKTCISILGIFMCFMFSCELFKEFHAPLYTVEYTVYTLRPCLIPVR